MKMTSKRRSAIPKGKKLLQIPLDAELHYKFKVYAVTNNQTMIGLIEQFVRQTVEKSEKGGK
jgi:hypothetical protein